MILTPVLVPAPVLTVVAPKTPCPAHQSFGPALKPSAPQLESNFVKPRSVSQLVGTHKPSASSTQPKLHSRTSATARRISSVHSTALSSSSSHQTSLSQPQPLPVSSSRSSSSSHTSASSLSQPRHESVPVPSFAASHVAETLHVSQRRDQLLALLRTKREAESEKLEQARARRGGRELFSGTEKRMEARGRWEEEQRAKEKLNEEVRREKERARLERERKEIKEERRRLDSLVKANPVPDMYRRTES
jgi:Skp family chaperone for outer membrane proteins